MLRFVPIILLLAACERTDGEPGPGGATISEAKALDDADAMLEERNEPTDEPAKDGGQ